jgi:glycosyltransferase involved in cell wall biosynthesis
VRILYHHRTKAEDAQGIHILEIARDFAARYHYGFCAAGNDPCLHIGHGHRTAPRATEYASPIKIFEYMGMGKCIVAPDQANIRELIEDGRTGVLFKPGSKDDMANALRRAISDPEFRKFLGRNARQEIFDKKYLWRNNAERAVSLLFSNRVLAQTKGNR